MYYINILHTIGYHVMLRINIMHNIDGSSSKPSISKMQNAECSGNTKSCFKTNCRPSVCYVYFCQFGRLCIQILVQAIDIS